MTVAVPETVAATVGVPEIVTGFPEAVKVRAVGNPVMFHVKGPMPAAVNDPLYGTPTVPFGNVPEIRGLVCDELPQLTIGIMRSRPMKRRNTLRRSIKASRQSARTEMQETF